jgi:hypothetical protein
MPNLPDLDDQLDQIAALLIVAEMFWRKFLAERPVGVGNGRRRQR